MPESTGQAGRKCQHCLTLEATEWSSVGIETGEKLGTHMKRSSPQRIPAHFLYLYICRSPKATQGRIRRLTWQDWWGPVSGTWCPEGLSVKVIRHHYGPVTRSKVATREEALSVYQLDTGKRLGFAFHFIEMKETCYTLLRFFFLINSKFYLRVKSC